jgi:hypothetical protein
MTGRHAPGRPRAVPARHAAHGREGGAARSGGPHQARAEVDPRPVAGLVGGQEGVDALQAGAARDVLHLARAQLALDVRLRPPHWLSCGPRLGAQRQPGA